VENLFGFTAGFPSLNSSAKFSMNLPGTVCCILAGQNSSTDVNVRKVSPSIVQSAPWPSNGSTFSIPAKRLKKPYDESRYLQARQRWPPWPAEKKATYHPVIGAK
jgi:hypothetical protein